MQSYNRSRKRPHGTSALMALVLGAAVFFCASGFAGGWLAEHVVRPVFSSFGLWTEQTAGTVPIPSPTPAPQIEVRTAGHTAYFLQTGVFVQQENAQREAEHWKAQGGAGYIAQEEERFRVMMAAYAKEEEAKAVRDRLKESDVETRVHTMSVQQGSVPVGTQAQADAMTQGLAAWQEILMQLFQAKGESLSQLEEALSDLLTHLESTFPSGTCAFADGWYELVRDCKQTVSQAAEEQDHVQAQALLQHACAAAHHGYLVLLAKFQ